MNWPVWILTFEKTVELVSKKQLIFCFTEFGFFSFFLTLFCCLRILQYYRCMQHLRWLGRLTLVKLLFHMKNVPMIYSIENALQYSSNPCSKLHGKKVKSKRTQLCEEITVAITQYLSFRYFNYWLWREISGQVMSNARNFWCLLNNIRVAVKNNIEERDLPFLNLYRYSNPQTNQTAESLQHTEESLWLAKITTHNYENQISKVVTSVVPNYQYT